MFRETSTNPIPASPDADDMNLVLDHLQADVPTRQLH